MHGMRQENSVQFDFKEFYNNVIFFSDLKLFQQSMTDINANASWRNLIQLVVE